MLAFAPDFRRDGTNSSEAAFHASFSPKRKSDGVQICEDIHTVITVASLGGEGWIKQQISEHGCV
jgi:hypothetical protein